MAIPAGLLQKILQGIGRVGKKVNRINPLRGAVRKPVPDYMREGTLGAPGRFYDSGADNFFDLFRPPNPNRAGSGYRPFATPTDPSKFAAPGSPLSARAKAAIDPGVSPMWGGPPFENPLSTEVVRRGTPPKDPGYWGRQAVTRKRFPNVEQKELHRQAIDPYDPKTQFLTGAEHGESTGDLIRLERELNRGRPKMLAELEELQRSFAPTDPRMQEIRELIDRLRGKV